MSSHYAKPENALRKATDLVNVGKASAALKTLHNILSARRYRLWTSTHEKIMFFYIDLAVGLRRNVKDALLQYRMICQQASTQSSGSMERVMRHYQSVAEEKANAAQAKAAEAAAAAESGKATGDVAGSDVGDVEDLEEESPESIMLAAMSGEGTKERLDRQILTPWVKYLWECYRTILEVLRNNGRLEVLYHHTARAAFDFCKRFHRNMEFRRLCEILRSHLQSIAKYQNQTNAVDLNSPETQTLYLETRFLQLRMASDLELWQEAYRTIEDIHESMRLSSKVEPPPELMKTYYEKLSQIFWASSNYLFHAYSLHKYYQLSSAAGSAEAAAQAIEPTNKAKLASAVVLSALIITNSKPPSDLHDIDGIAGVEQEGNMRLASLLGFKKETPSRQRILQAVQASGVLADANDVSKQIFRLLEHQFGPLTLYAQLKPLLAQLGADPELAKYVAPLEQLTVIRVLQQLSTVFKSMKMQKFQSLVPDVGSVFALERLILAAVTNDVLNVRFDHRTMTLIFPEGDLEQAQMRDQLVNLSRHFITLAHTLDSVAASPQAAADKLKERTHVFKLIQANLLEEHENVFLRQELIEKRKQELEKILIEKERKEAEAKAAAAAARRAEEQRRLAEETARREEERRRKEQAERDLRMKQQLAEEMKRKLEAATAASSIRPLKAEKRIQALTQDLENVDKITLMRAQEEILRAQQREVERRRKETARRIDYTVRAIRQEERAQLLAQAESKKAEEQAQLEADFAKYVETDRANHAKALAEKQRLSRMVKEKDVFYEKLMARRMEQFQVEKAKQQERLAVKAEKRRQAEERRRREEEERERQRAIEEEKARREREEAERQEALAAAERKRQEEERQKKLQTLKEETDRAREQQLERMRREEEAEQREKERRAAMRASADTGAPRGWGRPGGDDRFGGRRDGPPERDMGAFRSRAGGEEEWRGERAPERGPERGPERAPERSPDRDRDWGDLRNRPAPADGGSRWGAREEPRREESRFGRDRDFGGPRGRMDERGPPRGDYPDRRMDDRDRGSDARPFFGARRDGGDDRAGDFRRPTGGEREHDRMPSREMFGRAQEQQRGGAFERRGQAEREPFPRREAGGERELRRRDEQPAEGDKPRAAEAEARPPANAEQPADDDGFTTVRKTGRR